MGMNLSSAIILSVLIVIFVAIIASEIIKKKKGRSSCNCGGSCGACSMNCHSKEDQ